MMTAILLPASANPWAQVCGRLEGLDACKFKRIFCWRDEKARYDEFGSWDVTFVEDAWNNRQFGYGGESGLAVAPVDRGLLKIAREMLRRQEAVPGGVTEKWERWSVSAWVTYWMRELEDVDLVISPSIPHRFFDFICYVVAKSLNVRFITFQATGIPGYILPLQDIYSVLTDGIPLPSHLRASSEPILKAMDAITDPAADFEPQYMKDHRRNRKLSSIMLKKMQQVARAIRFGKFHKLFSPNTYWIFNDKRVGNWLTWCYLSVVREALRARYQKHFMLLVDEDKEVVFRLQEYCLVLLHYQPEETTMPSAFRYADQREIVAAVHRMFPSLPIVVKEHPNQFDRHLEGHLFRPQRYYEEIRKIAPNVHFCAQTIHNSALLPRAKYVVTATGTVGWEAAALGNPVIVFGRAWYEGMPNVIRYVSDEDCHNALKHWEPATSEEFSHWAENIASRSIRAKHYKTQLAGVSGVQSERALTELIFRFMELSGEKSSDTRVQR